MKAWVLCIAVSLSLVGTVAGLDAFGKRSRQIGFSARGGASAGQLHVVPRSTDLYPLWNSQGVRGRIVVQFSRFLYYVSTDNESLFQYRFEYPVGGYDVRSAFERVLDRTNYLWVSMNTGIARRIYHVVPPDVFLEKRALVEAGRREGTVYQLRLTADAILAQDHGSPRIIAASAPETAEPVLLAIHASYLGGSGADALLRLLREKRFITDLIVLCREEDNPDVSDEERRKLDELARMLRAGGQT